MSRTFIIAEAGVNHNGSIDLAKQLIDAAVVAGVDAVKFQTFKAEKLISIAAQRANYQKGNDNNFKHQFNVLKKLELNKVSHKILFTYCKKKHIEFLSSPFDLESINLLKDLGLKIFKIPSGEINNLPYLREIGKMNKKIIFSTGMSNLAEIENCLTILTEAGTKRGNITILHCNTEYPTPYRDVNLKAMNAIREAFKVKVGYSDHTNGIEVPIAAVALGATIIEKHFTLDKTMEGPDHNSSIEPDELNKMVQAIRHIELSLGNGIKKMTNSEAKNKIVARKSIVAATSIRKGEIFNENNITTKRPGYGMNPMNWDKIMGQVSNRNYKKDDLITHDKF